MITESLTNAFLLGLLQDRAKDVYRIALYTEDANLDADTPAYTTLGEASTLDVLDNPSGYVAGGMKLEGYRAYLVDGAAVASWADPVWPNASIAACAALIYNASQKNRAVAVIDLGKNFVSTNGNFIVTLPTELIRLG